MGSSPAARTAVFHRITRLIGECIDQFGLDLEGLRILTEAASGPYLGTPILAAAAGAERVYAFTRDTPYGAREHVRDETLAAADSASVADRLEVVFDREFPELGTCDIVTNSGMLRPMDETLVSRLKRTAVIPLMWETWEWRPEDLDLHACKQRGIVVLGTNESAPPLEMAPYCGLVGVRLLFELGLEVHRTRVLLLGSQPLIAGAIQAQLVREGSQVTRFGSDTAADHAYDQLGDHFLGEGHAYDALLVAEHVDRGLVVGPGGLLDPELIAKVNPSLAVGVVAGNVDGAAIDSVGLPRAPQVLQSGGLMSFQPADLGPRPVLELYAVGLAVGQAMARARLGGASPGQAARIALAESPAVDFPGDLAWT